MSKKATISVPVSKRALVQRLNRALAKMDETLKACRTNSRWYHDLGDFYTVDLRTNGIVDTNVDIEKLGRALEVLRPFERVESD